MLSISVLTDASSALVGEGGRVHAKLKRLVNPRGRACMA